MRQDRTEERCLGEGERFIIERERTFVGFFSNSLVTRIEWLEVPLGNSSTSIKLLTNSESCLLWKGSPAGDSINISKWTSIGLEQEVRSRVFFRGGCTFGSITLIPDLECSNGTSIIDLDTGVFVGWEITTEDGHDRDTTVA